MSELASTQQKVFSYLSHSVAGLDGAPSGELSFPFGSTRLHVRSFAAEAMPCTYVHVSALVARRVPISDELYRWVATYRHGAAFGHLQLSQDRSDGGLATLTIEHALLGDHLDPEELRLTVAQVASTADDVDDYVVSAFGGTRYIDADD